MAISAVVESLDNVAEGLRGEYEQGSDGKYYLSLDGLDSHTGVGALRRAKEHEKDARTKAEAAARDVAARLAAIEEERDGLLRGGIKKDDVDRLEASWKEKLARREQELVGERDALSGQLNTLLVDNVAHTIAARLSTSPELMLPHIKSRLRSEMVDGKAVTRVLNADGSPSAATPEEFEREIRANPMFDAILIHSNASGGGAAGGKQSNGGGAPAKINAATAKPTDLAAHIKANRAAR